MGALRCDTRGRALADCNAGADACERRALGLPPAPPPADDGTGDDACTVDGPDACTVDGTLARRADLPPGTPYWHPECSPPDDYHGPATDDACEHCGAVAGETCHPIGRTPDDAAWPADTFGPDLMPAACTGGCGLSVAECHWPDGTCADDYTGPPYPSDGPLTLFDFVAWASEHRPGALIVAGGDEGGDFVAAYLPGPDAIEFGRWRAGRAYWGDETL